MAGGRITMYKAYLSLNDFDFQTCGTAVGSIERCDFSCISRTKVNFIELAEFYDVGNFQAAQKNVTQTVGA